MLDLFERSGTPVIEEHGSRRELPAHRRGAVPRAEQVDDLLRIALLDDIPVLAYGIRTDFQTVAFPGSRRLLEVAHSLEELKTICRCGRKAIFNARRIAGEFVFDGDQVAIDGEDVTYESLCGVCYLEESGGMLHGRHGGRA